MTDATQRKARWLAIGAVISTIMVTLGVVSDYEEENGNLIELGIDAVETLLMVTGACGVGLLLDQLGADHRERLALMHSLAAARSEGEQWRARVQAQVRGIGAEIERQFAAWALTGAESEVGLLMLKGLSHKEIAAMRGTSDATGRQQARSIYQKSGLANRAAFCAYFLEDLLPAPEPPAPAVNGVHPDDEAPATEQQPAGIRQMS